MARMLVPAANFRSSTAVQGKSDVRDENVFSSLVLAHGGTGSAKLFTVPQGQGIPELKGSSITATTNAHQTSYTELTTNLTKAGELGSAIGDAAIRAIGIDYETAAYTAATGVNRTFGMTPFEVADVSSKCQIELKVGGKKQIEGPVKYFPQLGAAFMSFSTTANGATVGYGQNGMLPVGRKLKTHIPVGRTDALVVEWRVAGSQSLAFSNTGTDGQPSLAWVNLHSTIKGDVR